MSSSALPSKQAFAWPKKASILTHVVHRTAKRNVRAIRNGLQGSIPDAIQSWALTGTFGIGENRISGAIPDAIAGLAAASVLLVAINQLTGSIPQALVCFSMRSFLAGVNKFTGALPENMPPELQILGLNKNQLSGSLPDSMRSWARVTDLSLFSNAIFGSVPDALSHMTKVCVLRVDFNHLSGSIPSAVAHLDHLSIGNNMLSGRALEWAIAGTGNTSPLGLATGTQKTSHRRRRGSALAIAPLMKFMASSNQLTGVLPNAMHLLRWLHWLVLGQNQLRGTFPDTLHELSLTVLIANGNMLAGIIPECGRRMDLLDVSDNRLAGSILSSLFSPQLRTLRFSGNSLEGSLPRVLQVPYLKTLAVSGGRGVAAQLRGPLPSGLARVLELSVLLGQEQRLQGNIPRFISSLNIFVLYGNSFKVLPKMQFRDVEQARPLILFHHNLLSCHLPQLGVHGAVLSLGALGNHFWHPSAQEFPPWVTPLERDGLFWVSENDSLILGVKFASAVAVFAATVVRSLGARRSLAALSGWQAASGKHGVLARWCMHCRSNIMLATLRSLAFIPLLLHWNRYSCPRLLALASACLKDDTVICLIVIFCWGALCGHCSTGDGTPASGSRRQHRVTNILLVCLWFPLGLALSALASLDQACKSVPGFLDLKGGKLRALSGCIGFLQSATLKVVLPRIATCFPDGMRLVERFTSLLVIFVIPGSVVIYLDGACCAHWASFWKPCSPKLARQFDYVLHCPGDPRCPTFGSAKVTSAITILSSIDICRPQRMASASTCVQSALLRLQDMWLSKWIVSGLALPSARMLRRRFEKEPLAVAQQVTSALEMAILVTGPLPLLAPLLLLAMVSEIVIAAASWERGFLREMADGDVLGEGWLTTKILLAGLCMAFANSDMCASNVAALLILCMAWSGYQRRASTTREPDLDNSGDAEPQSLSA